LIGKEFKGFFSFPPDLMKRMLRIEPLWERRGLFTPREGMSGAQLDPRK
jgi:hypothetical protein